MLVVVDILWNLLWANLRFRISSKCIGHTLQYDMGKGCTSNEGIDFLWNPYYQATFVGKSGMLSESVQTDNFPQQQHELLTQGYLKVI